jgi:hypothetical protein
MLARVIPQIDGGEDREITVETGVYHDAAGAVPALLGLPLPTTITIWSPPLVKGGFGPYFFRVEEDRYEITKYQGEAVRHFAYHFEEA